MSVILLHTGDLVDPAIRFNHVDDQTVVGAVINRISRQPVAWQSVQGDSLEAPAKTLSCTEKTFFQFLLR
jgi:hypothetical protein